jgi:hypothetical protein
MYFKILSKHTSIATESKDATDIGYFSAAASIVGVALMFTPLAPLGTALLLAGDAASIASGSMQTNIGIKTHNKADEAEGGLNIALGVLDIGSIGATMKAAKAGEAAEAAGEAATEAAGKATKTSFAVRGLASEDAVDAMKAKEATELIAENAKVAAKKAAQAADQWKIIAKVIQRTELAAEIGVGIYFITTGIEQIQQKAVSSGSGTLTFAVADVLASAAEFYAMSSH